jgi:hypothetical protein
MAKITKKEKLVLTRAEAYSLIKNADGRVRFQLKVSAFLPIPEELDENSANMGFEGCTFISVSREVALKVSQELLSETLERRGGRLRIETDPADSERGLSFISIS